MFAFQQTKYRKGQPRMIKCSCLRRHRPDRLWPGRAHFRCGILQRAPTPSAPMIAAVYDWSGFYIGAQWRRRLEPQVLGHHDNILGAPVVPPVSEGCHTATGGVAGGQFGYRWQTGAWVFGLEAQGDWADLSGTNVRACLSAAPAQPLEDRCLRSVHRPGRLRLEQRPALRQGRRGRDRRQVSRASSPPPASCSTTPAKTPAGAAWSAPASNSASPQLVGRRRLRCTASWDRATTLTFDTAGAFSRADRIRQDVDIVTARVNYRLGGPVIAKY